MALEAYNRKRDFDKTREPSGEVKTTPGGNQFVIQKHAASRLRRAPGAPLNAPL